MINDDYLGISNNGEFRDIFLNLIQQKTCTNKRELAKTLNINYSTLASYLNGANRLPASLLIELSLVYGFSIDELIRESLGSDKDFNRNQLINNISTYFNSEKLNKMDSSGLNLLYQILNLVQESNQYKLPVKE